MGSHLPDIFFNSINIIVPISFCFMSFTYIVVAVLLGLSFVFLSIFSTFSTINLFHFNLFLLSY